MILLNSQQQDALIKMDKFINSRNEKVFLPEGFAGTGKTTVITSYLGQENILSLILYSRQLQTKQYLFSKKCLKMIMNILSLKLYINQDKTQNY